MVGDCLKKYSISPEFGIYRNLRIPFCHFSFVLSSIFGFFSKNLLFSDDSICIHRYTFSHRKSLSFLLFEPRMTNSSKILIYFHGGAFVYKGYSKHFSLCKRYAIDGNCKVLYVDYSLAPRYCYPFAMEDAFFSYQWVLEHADMLGIHPNKIMIGGDSAGGCIAADLAFQVLEKNLNPPLLLLLIYPVLDRRMQTDSMKHFSNTPMWNAKLNEKMWRLFLQGNSYISPSERIILKDFPFTYLEVAEFDCLYDEGMIFAQNVTHSSVYEVKGAMHGFDIKNCSITEQAILNRVRILKKCDEKNDRS